MNRRQPSARAHRRNAAYAGAGHGPWNSIAVRASAKREVRDSLHSGRSRSKVNHVSSRLTSSYWWMMKFRFAIASDQSTPCGARMSSLDSRWPLRRVSS